MGHSFTTSQPSTPSAPRETWQQRMSRRSHQRCDPRDPRDGATLRFCHSHRPSRPRSAHNMTTKHHAGEQEEVDQLTAFRTGAFDGLDSRNGAAP